MSEIVTIVAQRPLDGVQRLYPVVVMFVIIGQIGERGFNLSHLAVELIEV